MPERRRDIDPAHLAVLNAGLTQTRTLTEALAVDQAVLLSHVVPDASPELGEAVVAAQQLGILRRMAATGAALRTHLDPAARRSLALHQSDTVRGWACFALDTTSHADVATVVETIRPLADDEHFAVREWAWMAIRPRLTEELDRSIALLASWTAEDSERLRRFASEALRPRGVWASHIGELKEHPERGLSILEPLRSDPSRYVQDSVANWVNDAAKSRPDWATDLCDRWLAESPTPQTRRIVERALRSLTKSRTR